MKLYHRHLIFRRLTSIALVVVGLVVAPCLLHAALGDTNEVWISARTNALGTGMIAGAGPRETWGAITNPFYGDFDAIINSLSANTTIHLLPGIHHSKGWEAQSGNPLLKAYQKVIGAGIDTTTVFRDTSCGTCPYDNADCYSVLFSFADGVEVSDLTVDCNGQGPELHKVGGVGSWGNYCAIRRVKVIHPVGITSPSAFSESFAIFLGFAGTVGSVIEDCEVSSARGTEVTGIQINGQGIVRGNRVFFPIITGDAGLTGYSCYNVSSSFNAVYEGNYSEGGNSGFYSDTGLETNLTIINNSFTKAYRGIDFAKNTFLISEVIVPGGVNGVLVANNFIELSGNINGGNGIGFYTSDSSQYTNPSCNIALSDNTIKVDQYITGNNGVVLGSSWDTNFHNMRVVGNTIDRALPAYTFANGNWFADNTDLQGVPLHVRQLGSGSPSSVSLGFLDGAVFVTGSTTSLTLPNAFGFSGKEVIIVNQNYTRASVTVNAVTGNSILPSGPVSVPVNQTVKFISDGSNNWVQN